MIRDIQKIITKWELVEEVNFELPEYNGDHKQMWCKESHSLLAEIRPNGVLTIYPKFKWDGCSYKWRVSILGKSRVVGVWDGRERVDGKQEFYEASMVHDCLIRFHRHFKGRNFYTYSDIDKIFLNTAKQYSANFFQRWIYYGAVRVYSCWRKVVGDKKHRVEEV